MILALAIAAATPTVMSADFCADQYALKLADSAQIIALSPDAEKDFSYMRAQSAGIPQYRPDAEIVAALAPDIVLRFWGGDADRFATLGARVVTLDYASDFDGVAANIRRTAEALGQPRRGQALIDEMRARLASLAESGAGPRVLYVTPGGVTAGAGTMIDAVISASGAVNAAAAAGLAYWPPLPAEAVVAEPPSHVVTGFFTAGSERVNHWSAARHPAFRKTFAAARTAHLETDTISCPGWFSVDAAEAIADAMEEGIE